jgi:hypothetical protein
MKESILQEAQRLITGPRQATYSHPYDDYSKVIEIFKALTGVQLTLEQALLFMVSVKFARLRTNLAQGKFHRDSAVDAAGYLGCLELVVDIKANSTMTAEWNEESKNG